MINRLNPLIFPQRLKFKPISPFKTKSYIPTRTLWSIIDAFIAVGRPPLIVLEGGAQTGKTTAARYICMHYDQNYNLLYSVQDTFKIMEIYKQMYFSGNTTGMLWKANLLDEPQLIAPTIKYHDERALALQKIISGWGELKQILCIAIPDIDDIGKRFYRNLCLRLQMYAKKNKETKIVEHFAMVYKPYKPIGKKTWKWWRVGRFKFPDVPQDQAYLARKMDNFFNDKLPEMENDVKIQLGMTARQLKRGERDPFTPPDILD